MPKEKVQKDKHRLTKHTYKTKDRVTRTLQKAAGELGCPGRVSSSCSTGDTRRVKIYLLMINVSSSFSIYNFLYIALATAPQKLS